MLVKMMCYSVLPTVLLNVAAFNIRADMTPAEAEINVREFGAIPGDGQDDTKAIISALDAYKTRNARKLIFDAGQYDLGRSGFRIYNINNLAIEGAVDSDGKPSTRFVRHHDLINNPGPIPFMLDVRNCTNLTINNILFDNDPQYTTAGEVVEVTADSVTVRIPEGLPRIDGMGAYCMNAWDLKTRRLKRQQSLTFGKDVDNSKKELSWYVTGPESDRLMRMNSSKIASQVKIGDGLSWHAGYLGTQVSFLYCDNLKLNNIWTVNTIGFAYSAQRCENITADRVTVKAEGSQLAVGSRDGWKLYGCNGTVKISNMYIEGVRWDGQNVHGTFFKVEEILEGNRLKIKSATRPIKTNTKVEFWNGAEHESRMLTACQVQAPFMIITLESQIPSFVKKDTIISAYGLDIQHYELNNCTFKSIAGCASLLRNSHALIQNCTYDNIMYPAVFVGASLVEAEGMSPQDVTIQNCTFIDSGWIGRQSANGMIAARTWGSDLPLNGAVRILNNTFRDGELGVNIFGTDSLKMSGNTFERVATPYQFDAATVNHHDISTK